MSKHEWTAEEVHGLVKDWPREAWPDEARPNLDTWRSGECLNARLMSLLFTASGLEFLSSCEIDTLKDGTVWLWIDGKKYEGPPLLRAVSEAIKHTQGKE